MIPTPSPLLMTKPGECPGHFLNGYSALGARLELAEDDVPLTK